MFCRKKAGVQRTGRAVNETIGTLLHCCIHVFKSQSFSKLEAGTLLVAPGCCVGKETAGSPWGRCCPRTEQAGTCHGRGLGLCTPGQTR